MYDINLITKVFERDMNKKVRFIHQFENVPNNTVYRIDTDSEAYIFKLYSKSDWPEDGKLLFVERKLTEQSIPHAKIHVYSKGNTDFPNGYLIEECLSGTTADRLPLSPTELVELFGKLGDLVSQIHQISTTNFGYIGTGIANWPHFSEFMYNSFEENTSNLISSKLISRHEIDQIWEEIYHRLKVCDTYPPTLCHGDLSTKNIMVHQDKITLIDWDDAYSLCWIADLASLTFWIKREYGSDADIYRMAFLERYQTSYDMNKFYEIESILHVRYALDLLNCYLDTPQSDSLKTHLNEALEKSGMKVLSF